MIYIFLVLFFVGFKMTESLLNNFINCEGVVSRENDANYIIRFPCSNIQPLIQRIQLGGSYDLRISRNQVGGSPFSSITFTLVLISDESRSAMVRINQYQQRDSCILFRPGSDQASARSTIAFALASQECGTTNGQLVVVWTLEEGVTYNVTIAETSTTDPYNTVTRATVRVSREARIVGEANTAPDDPFNDFIEEDADQDNDLPIFLGSSRKIQNNLGNIISVEPRKSSFRCGLTCYKEIRSTKYQLSDTLESIPNITIAADTIRSQNDIGIVTMIVKDTVSYHDLHFPPCNEQDQNCREIIVNRIDVIETVFQRFINYNLVVKGEGCTLRDKINYLITKYNIQISSAELMIRVTLYGALKYILSRLMYGRFDARFLLGKYNKKFFQDLSRSRFCQFRNAFRSPELRGIGCLFKTQLLKEDRPTIDRDQDFIFREKECKDIRCDDNAIARQPKKLMNRNLHK
ncbi:Hypothetical protein POVR1_LOCUS409 [uncultured virus]|nr:Hypothetical protein POVR1_LOCUS409 [uncultured virus]